jgi:hypothetical protein
MQTIPIQPVPSQQFQVTLDGQLCAFSIYVKNQCMFFDALVNGAAISYSVQCKNLVNLIPTAYLGFTGLLVFNDTQGTSDPVYTGLGSRWVLLYLDAADLEVYGLSI